MSASSAVLIGKVDHVQILHGIDGFDGFCRRLPISVGRERYLRLLLFGSVFGGDKDHTVCSSCSVDGC